MIDWNSTAQSMDDLHAWAGMSSPPAQEFADTPHIWNSGAQPTDHLQSIQSAQVQDVLGPMGPRLRIGLILAGVIVGWWLLGKLWPGKHVSKAHKAVAPGVAGTAVTQAAAGV